MANLLRTITLLCGLFIGGIAPGLGQSPAQKNIPSGITMANLGVRVKNPHSLAPDISFLDPFNPAQAFGEKNITTGVFPPVIENILRNKIKATGTVTDPLSFNSVRDYLTLETYAHEWTHKNDYKNNGFAFIKTNMLRNYPLTFKQANSTQGVPTDGFNNANSQAYRNCTAHAIEITAYLEGRAAVTMIALRARFLYDLQQSLKERIANWQGRDHFIPGTMFLKFADLFTDELTPKPLDDIITLAEQCVLADFGRAKLSFGLPYAQAYRETVMPNTVHSYVKKDGKLIVAPLATMDEQFRIVVKVTDPEHDWAKIHGGIFNTLPGDKYQKSLSDFTDKFKTLLKTHAPTNCREYYLSIRQVKVPSGQEVTEIAESSK